MARLQSVCSINWVQAYEEEGIRTYYPCFKEEWKELKEKLNNYGISFKTSYDIEFLGEQYKLGGKPQPFGARDVYVYYGDTCVAKSYISGSNYCDREGRLEIYLSKLKKIYK